jgi:hypothetical protein
MVRAVLGASRVSFPRACGPACIPCRARRGLRLLGTRMRAPLTRSARGANGRTCGGEGTAVASLAGRRPNVRRPRNHHNLLRRTLTGLGATRVREDFDHSRSWVCQGRAVRGAATRSGADRAARPWHRERALVKALPSSYATARAAEAGGRRAWARRRAARRLTAWERRARESGPGPQVAALYEPTARSNEPGSWLWRIR